MNRLVSLGLVACLAWGCSDEVGRDEALGGSGPSGDVAAGGAATAGRSSEGEGGGGGDASTSGGAPTGAALFGMHCAACHEEKGSGGLKAPEIQHPVRDYATWVVRNGRPADPKWAMPMAKFAADELSDADLTLILDYLDEPPQPTSGQTLYRDYCQNCHGVDGKSKPADHDITQEVDELAKMVRDGAHAGEYTKRDGFMPKFSTTRLTDAEVELIRAYVDTI